MPDSLASIDPQEEQIHLLPQAVSTQELLSYSLVLSAIGIDHTVDIHKGNLQVSEGNNEAAISHLRAYEQENKNWPPPQASPPPEGLGGGHISTLLLLASLLACFQISGSWNTHAPLFELGAVDSGAILEQEQWWRLVTGLSLHADEEHLTGNLLIGGSLLYFLSRHLGFGLAPLLLILSGTFGNLLNIVLRDSPHLSVGFSTAVFGCIGLFTGSRMLRTSAGFIAAVLPPLGAGVALLTFLGTAGERSDLGAHLFGFVCGILLGLLFEIPLLRGLRRHIRAQFICLFLAALLPTLCWWLALISRA